MGHTDPALLAVRSQRDNDDADAPAVPATAAHDADETLRQRIGQLTRTLHDALCELGYDRDLRDARDDLPDARDRLAYIARVTGEAAEKVLNAVDRARSVQKELTEQAVGLRNRWRALAAHSTGGLDCSRAGKQLIDETC